MRVLVICHTFPNPWEPLRDPHVAQQVIALSEYCEVRAVVPVSWPKRLRGYFRKTEVDQSRFPFEYPVWWYPPRVQVGQHGMWMWRSIRRHLTHLVEEFQPDVIFAPWTFPDGWAALQLKLATNLPLVIKSRGTDILGLSEQSRRRKPTCEVLKAADGLVAVSRHLADHLLDLGADPLKTHVIYNGVDTEMFCPGNKSVARERLGLNNRPCIVFVGALKPVKQIDVLLDACHQLAREGVGFQCHIIGEGPLRASLETQAQRLGLFGCVRFQGPLSANQLPDWYRAADVVALPSRSEGLPNVLLEGLACGTPFVASRVGGVPEIAGHPSNRLVQSGDSQALAHALGETLADRRTGVEDFGVRSWAESAADLSDMLAAACTRPAELRLPAVSNS